MMYYVTEGTYLVLLDSSRKIRKCPCTTKLTASSKGFTKVRWTTAVQTVEYSTGQHSHSTDVWFIIPTAFEVSRLNHFWPSAEFNMFVSPKVRSACWTLERIYSSVCRTYVSRAHPSASTPTIPISEAIVSVLGGIEERKITREERWQRGAEKRAVKGIKVCFMLFLLY